MVANLSKDGVGEARLFVDTGALFPDAYPDGPIVDAEDHVWTGLYLGAHVARFSPDGKLVATVRDAGARHHQDGARRQGPEDRLRHDRDQEHGRGGVQAVPGRRASC